jgi:hypothetical protein
MELAPVLTNAKVPTSFDFLPSQPVSMFPKGKISIDQGSKGQRFAYIYGLKGRRYKCQRVF